MRKSSCRNVLDMQWKVLFGFTQDYEEQLMFCLHEEDEEDDQSQSDSGTDFIFLIL